MSKVNQKTAIYNAVVSVKGEIPEGVVTMSKEERAQVNMILVAGFKAGTIELDKEYDEAGLKT